MEHVLFATTRYNKAISRLTAELMKVLSSLFIHGNYLTYCRGYAKAVIEHDLYYDYEQDRFFNIDDGDDIEIDSHQCKHCHPVTIDISEI